MKKTLQIRQSLWVFMAAIFLAFVAGGIAGPLRIAIIQGKTNLILDQEIPALQAVYNIEQALADQSVETYKFFDHPDLTSLNRIKYLRNQYLEAVRRFERYEDKELQAKVMGDIQSIFTEMSARQDILFARFFATGTLNPAGGALTQKELDEERAQILNRQRDISAILEFRLRKPTQDVLKTTGEYVQKAGQAATLVTYGVLGLTALLGALAAWRLTRRISRPLQELVSAMALVEQGGRTMEPQGLRNDEFGMIGRNMAAMVEALVSAEAGLARLNAEQGRILESVRMGLLTLDKDYRIGSARSRFADWVFAPRNLTGMDFGDLVFPKPGQALDRDILARFLRQINSNKIVAQSMLDDINPLKDYVLSSGDDSGKVRRLEFHFHPIAQGQEGILVIFEDVTDLVNARMESDKERQRREGDLEVLYQALQIGPDIVKADLARCIDQCTAVTQAMGGQVSKDEINLAFRHLHSLKGSAAAMGFATLASHAHELEAVLQNLRGSKGIEYVLVPEGFVQELASLGGEIRQAAELVDKLLGSAALQAHAPQSPSQVFAGRIQTLAENLAKELSKEVLCDVKIHESILAYEGMGDAIIHLVRNALDHGIEETFERLALGKKNPALIRIHCEESDGQIHVNVTDDGRGLDYGRIEAAARAKGLLGPETPVLSQQEAARLIFKPGFSSKDEVTDISGRGVGLDAVKATVNRHNGRITLTSQPGKGTRFRMSLPLPGRN